MNEIKLHISDYKEVMACLELIQKFSENPRLLNSRYKLREINRFSKNAYRYLDRSFHRSFDPTESA